METYRILQQQLMAGTTAILELPAAAPLNPVEEQKLGLPSSLTEHQRRREALRPFVEPELELRRAQCNDALSSVKTHLLWSKRVCSLVLPRFRALGALREHEGAP